MAKLTPLEEIGNEANRAKRKHGSFVCKHQMYAVILEEVDELWTEIKRKKTDPNRAREELIQIAAVALKGIDFCDSGEFR